MLILYAPEVEMELPSFDGSVQIYRGIDRVRAWYQDFLSAITEFTATVGEWIDGASEVIAVLRYTGRGRKSGALSSVVKCTCGRCATASSGVCVYTRPATKPSKPWGSRSRRCRSTTWRSCGGRSRPSTR